VLFGLSHGNAYDGIFGPLANTHAWSTELDANGDANPDPTKFKVV